MLWLFLTEQISKHARLQCLCENGEIQAKLLLNTVVTFFPLGINDVYVP